MIVSPQDLGLWNPFHPWPFYGLYMGVIRSPLTKSWDDPPNRPSPRNGETGFGERNLHLVVMTWSAAGRKFWQIFKSSTCPRRVFLFPSFVLWMALKIAPKHSQSKTEGLNPRPRNFSSWICHSWETSLHVPQAFLLFGNPAKITKHQAGRPWKVPSKTRSDWCFCVLPSSLGDACVTCMLMRWEILGLLAKVSPLSSFLKIVDSKLHFFWQKLSSERFLLRTSNSKMNNSTSWLRGRGRISWSSHINPRLPLWRCEILSQWCEYIYYWWTKSGVTMLHSGLEGRPKCPAWSPPPKKVDFGKESAQQLVV